MAEQTIRRITEALHSCTFITGIVLGGSRATGTAGKDSDIDIGIYYDKSELDYDQLNDIARQLDDDHRENLICREGGWGHWVNCGGWLVVDGFRVDFILRDMIRVRECIRQTDNSIVTSHYQPGHPHAFLNVMYRGELGSCRLLYARDQDFKELKKQAEYYPDCLIEAFIHIFRFEAGFSAALARTYSKDQDVYYVTGHLFRSVSALNQVLFAVNRTYCLNEKKATLRIDSFPAAPANYRNRVNQLLTLTPETMTNSFDELDLLCHEVEAIADRTPWNMQSDDKVKESL